jgi:hypothetical protein
VTRMRVTGTAAQAHLLAGWLRSRLGHDVELEHEQADRLEGVELDGEPARAQELVGAAAWELVRPNRPPPGDRLSAGLSVAELSLVVDELEAI